MDGLQVPGVRSRRLVYKEVVEVLSDYKKSFFWGFGNPACEDSTGSNPISSTICRHSTDNKSHCSFSPLPSSLGDTRPYFLQSDYSKLYYCKQDSQTTRSKISYSLIEPELLPCTLVCCYEFHALSPPKLLIYSNSSRIHIWDSVGSL